jgi:hypothetical protein
LTDGRAQRARQDDGAGAGRPGVCGAQPYREGDVEIVSDPDGAAATRRALAVEGRAAVWVGDGDEPEREELAEELRRGRRP